MSLWLLDKVLATKRFVYHQRRPRRIVLVRHGESEANVDPTVYFTVPDNRISLTELGKEQCRALGRDLKQLFGDKRVRCYVSPLCRTLQTLEAIAEAFPTSQLTVRAASGLSVVFR